MKALHEIAHARAGDKGDTSIIMVAPYDEEDYPRLRAALRVAEVARHFGVVEENVGLFPADGLCAISVVIRARLAGGVTRSPTVDPHGKTLSGHLLELRVEWGAER
jgi:hypothetical protein